MARSWSKCSAGAGVLVVLTMPVLSDTSDTSLDAVATARLVETWAQPHPVASTPVPSTEGSVAGVTSTFLSMNQDPEGDMPRDAAYTPDGTQLVVVNRDTDNVVFFDTTTLEAKHTVDVGDFPTDVAVTPNGELALIPNVFDNTVSIIDVATHTLVTEVPITGEQPFAIAVTSDSAHAIVAVINPAGLFVLSHGGNTFLFFFSTLAIFLLSTFGVLKIRKLEEDTEHTA